MFTDIRENNLEIEAKYRLEGSLSEWVLHFEDILKIKPDIVDKEDIYYEINNFFFRIRKDREIYTCNFKEKTNRDSLEVNLENETVLHDISFWRIFISKMQAKTTYQKVKKGFSFLNKPFFLELVEVNALGVFAEIEYQGTFKPIEVIKKEMDEFTSFLKIPDSSLEERSYKELLNF